MLGMSGFLPPVGLLLRNTLQQADAEQWPSIASRPGASIHLAIEVSGEAVGGIGIIAGPGVGQSPGRLGYWLGESLWGRGTATASVNALATYALVQLQFVCA
jgi:RimJ/RimL family protein N-acetyltransferase